MASPATRDDGSLSDRRKAALLRWRVRLDADHPGRSLTDYDLELIANSPAVQPALIGRIPMVSSKPLLRHLADELSRVLLAVEPGTAAGPQPVAEPAESQSESPPRLASLTFARLDLERASDMGTPVEITPTVTAAGGLRLQWPAAPGSAAAVVIYRLVDAPARRSPPEYGEQLAVTFGLAAQDHRPFEQSVRFYQVWVHAGADEASAAAAQPRLHAVHAAVAPVQDCDIVVDETVVVGRWRHVPGTSRVEVHRLAPGDSYSPANRLLDEVYLDGFRDATGRPARTYQYDVYAMASIDGAETQSAPVSQAVTIPTRLEPVVDLQVHVYETDDQALFDLTWTPPPNGQVRIYRTEREPNPGLHDESRPLDAIEREGLDDGALVKHATRTEGDRARVVGVPWPSGWPRAHFTPVTVDGGTGRVGPSVAKVRARPVRDAMLVERVDYQVAVFGWPAGAASVAAYLTPPGIGMPDPLAYRPQAEISREGYQRDGGLELSLGGDPLDVHLLSKIWDRGVPAFGDPVVLHYPGLLRLAYQLLPVPPVVEERGMFRRRSAPATPAATHALHLAADRALDATPHLALVHNSQRMPLSPYDGTFVAQIPQVPVGKSGYTEATRLDLGGCRGGYVRLFLTQANLSVTVAVLDPDIEMLRRP